jgi:hypothetical protein
MHTPLGFQNKILREFLDSIYKNRVKKIVFRLRTKIDQPLLKGGG